MATKKGTLSVIGKGQASFRSKREPSSQSAEFSSAPGAAPVCGPQPAEDTVEIAIEEVGPASRRRYKTVIKWQINGTSSRSIDWEIEFE